MDLATSVKSVAKASIPWFMYAALLILVGAILYGSWQFYFNKKAPTVQNFLPESKPNFTTINSEKSWAIGPYIELRSADLKEVEWVFGGRLEYRF